jgi:hypothetical protein
MALQFESPRFAGDALLEEILNDPDTGTKKLGPGSPADSVMKLQQALFDLLWTEEIAPPVTSHDAFVIGIYGPKTTEIVTTYKRHYGIHFPGDPPDQFDGFAGPRTFRRLDEQCVLFDEAVAAIATKAAELTDAGIPATLTGVSERGTIREIGTSGTFTTADIGATQGAILYKRGIGAFEVHGRIFDEYLKTGLGEGAFGFPITDEHDDGPGFVASDFEFGKLRCELATGVVAPTGPSPAAPQTTVF